MAKGGRIHEGSAQVPVPAGGGGLGSFRLAGGNGSLAQALNQDGFGGSGGPSNPMSAPPEARSGERELAFMDLCPGERRVYRVGEALFRAWIDSPDAGAEIYKSGDWVWTPIPSGAISAHPNAEALTAHECAQLPVPQSMF
jgi:hypothetical protein